MAVMKTLYFEELHAHEENQRRIVADLSAFDHVTHFVDFGTEDEYDKVEEELQPAAQKARAEADLDRSTVISSAIYDDDRDDTWETRRHTIALDIDHRVRVVPSSTEGHSHLYIDVPLEWDDYARLLDLLGELDIVETGYVAASKRRRGTHLRLPWIEKQPIICSDSEVIDGNVAYCADLKDHDGGHLYELMPGLDLLEAF